MSFYRKSADESEKLRKEGNSLYLEKKFFGALIKYNESLCYAEQGSENLGLVYANRSAVYFELKIFQACLENIKLARDNFYPSNKLEILTKRQEKCKLLQIDSDTNDLKADDKFFRLSYKAHEKLPHLANCLELKINQKYGRHIVTKRKLKTGDVIALDFAQFKVIKADSRYDTCDDKNIYQRCSNCLRDNFLNLIPCNACTRTMYCSSECMNSAFTRYHRFECEIIEDLLIAGVDHIVMRLLFEGLSIFNDDLNEMEKSIGSNLNGKSPTIFNSSPTTFDDGSKFSTFLLTFSLGSSEFTAKIDTSDEYHRKIESLLNKSKMLKSLWLKMTNSNGEFLRSLLTQLHRIGENYVHGIGGWTLQKMEIDETESGATSAQLPSAYQKLIGNGCYLFCSLLNHSCAPNIHRLNLNDDKVAVVVTRPIEAGEQLFDSYRPNFNVQPKKLRQENLFRDYNFKCECEACINDYPVNKYLKVYDETLLEMAWDVHENLPQISKPDAIQRIKTYYEIVDEQCMKKHFPSSELIVLLQCIYNCLILITKPSIQF